MGKYKYIVFVFFGVILCLIRGVFAKDESKGLLFKVIYIDPGHGGTGYIKYYEKRL